MSKFVKALALGLLGTVSFAGSMLVHANNSACPNNETRFPGTGLCTGKALELIKSVDSNGPTGLLTDGCKWSVNEASLVGDYFIYYAAHCKGKTAQLEGGGGAHAASIELIWSALSNAAGEERVATVIALHSDDPQTDIRNFSLEPKERKGCRVRSGDVSDADWPKGALVLDDRLGPEVSMDGPRAACGEFGYDQETNNHWRIMGDTAWFLMPRPEAYQDIDIFSLTFIEKAANGGWKLADKQLFRQSNKTTGSMQPPSSQPTNAMGSMAQPASTSGGSTGSMSPSSSQPTNATGSMAQPVSTPSSPTGSMSLQPSSQPVSTAGSLSRRPGKPNGLSTNNNSVSQKSIPKPSQKPERIKFARGAVSATVTGELSGYGEEKAYVLGVGKGQIMIVEQVNKTENRYISTYLTAPDGSNANDMDISCHSSANVSSTKPGDYTIKVVQCAKADPWKGSFSLKVTVK